MIVVSESNINSCILELADEFKLKGKVFTSESWQSVKNSINFYEINNVVLNSRTMPQNLIDMTRFIKPNQPWADVHFEERIGGNPLNPGESYKMWPFYGQDEKMRNQGQKFSHTYMERFWPKKAGFWPTLDGFNKGIRYNYGDLKDVVELLRKEPTTRQAFLPVWFPEDTGSVSGVRVPCTIGYLFSMRDGQLNLTYYIRSCDFFRHFADDVYLAMRLALWVKNQINPEIKLGEFCMYIANLHIFEREINKLHRLYP